ncbi:MAG: hypothetical protein ABI298_01975 [Acidimicrobiales bacterium]
MDAFTLAEETAESTQTLGMSFYFDPLTGARAKEIGLNIFQFYGLGRGGTLGDVDVIQAAFTFFHPRAIGRLWTDARAKSDPSPLRPTTCRRRTSSPIVLLALLTSTC